MAVLPWNEQKAWVHANKFLPFTVSLASQITNRQWSGHMHFNWNVESGRTSSVLTPHWKTTFWTTISCANFRDAWPHWCQSKYVAVPVYVARIKGRDGFTSIDCRRRIRAGPFTEFGSCRLFHEILTSARADVARPFLQLYKGARNVATSSD